MKIWLKVNTRDWSGSITVARTTTKWNCLSSLNLLEQKIACWDMFDVLFVFGKYIQSLTIFFSISLFAYFNILERKVANFTSSLTFRLNKINWLLASTRTSSSVEELAVVTCHIIISKEKCWTPGLLDSIKKKNSDFVDQLFIFLYNLNQL